MLRYSLLMHLEMVWPMRDCVHCMFIHNPLDAPDPAIRKLRGPKEEQVGELGQLLQD